MSKGKNYEVVSKKANYIWGCSDKRDAEEQLRFVKKELNYDDAFIVETDGNPKIRKTEVLMWLRSTLDIWKKVVSEKSSEDELEVVKHFVSGELAMIAILEKALLTDYYYDNPLTKRMEL